MPYSTLLAPRGPGVCNTPTIAYLASRLPILPWDATGTLAEWQNPVALVNHKVICYNSSISICFLYVYWNFLETLLIDYRPSQFKTVLRLHQQPMRQAPLILAFNIPESPHCSLSPSRANYDPT